MARMWVLLPCFDEEQALPGLLTRFQETLPQLSETQSPAYDAINELTAVVVDDGSCDGTAQIARDAAERPKGEAGFSVILLQHDRNLGLGAAMRTGISHFQGASGENDWLAATDCDGTHPPELLPEMLQAARERSLNVVIASRYAPSGAEIGLSPSRKVYSRTCSWGLGALFRLRGVRDYTCGFRLYSRKALVRARERYGDSLIRERGFVCQAELLIHLARVGARIGEVPLVLRYDQKRSRSKMRVLHTIWRYTVMTARELSRR
ncbi:MAG: hypothetical protein A2Y63_02410 [Candidatus Riflebacteria bacterium RBG_13_59_9]|nr:MAG: hypothetical protein A2Y63_02410 [Candidatus Riflebacteria bacterium RBG_13_59_9]